MKKYLAEGVVIFASIFASFSVENLRQNSIEKETIAQGLLGSSEDYQIGTKAFFEKSTPKFTGR